MVIMGKGKDLRFEIKSLYPALVGQVFLVGDPVQLPATVISKRAVEFGYDISMFKRLQEAGHPVQVWRQFISPNKQAFQRFLHALSCTVRPPSLILIRRGTTQAISQSRACASRKESYLRPRSLQILFWRFSPSHLLFKPDRVTSEGPLQSSR